MRLSAGLSAHLRVPFLDDYHRHFEFVQSYCQKRQVKSLAGSKKGFKMHSLLKPIYLKDGISINAPFAILWFEIYALVTKSANLAL